MFTGVQIATAATQSDLPIGNSVPFTEAFAALLQTTEALQSGTAAATDAAKQCGVKVKRSDESQTANALVGPDTKEDSTAPNPLMALLVVPVPVPTAPVDSAPVPTYDPAQPEGQDVTTESPMPKTLDAPTSVQEQAPVVHEIKVADRPPSSSTVNYASDIKPIPDDPIVADRPNVNAAKSLNAPESDRLNGQPRIVPAPANTVHEIDSAAVTPIPSPEIGKVANPVSSPKPKTQSGGKSQEQSKSATPTSDEPPIAEAPPNIVEPKFSVRDPKLGAEDAKPAIHGPVAESPRQPAPGALSDDPPVPRHPVEKKETIPAATNAAESTGVVTLKVPDLASVSQPHAPVPQETPAVAHVVAPGTDNRAADHGEFSPSNLPTAASTAQSQQLPSSPDTERTAQPGAVNLVSRLEQQELRFGWTSQDFGRIEVRTTLQHDRVGAVISASDPQLRESLRDHMASLDRALSGHSLELSSFSTFDNSASQNAPRDQSRQQYLQHPSWRSHELEVPASTSATTPATRPTTGLLDLRA